MRTLFYWTTVFGVLTSQVLAGNNWTLLNGSMWVVGNNSSGSYSVPGSIDEYGNGVSPVTGKRPINGNPNNVDWATSTAGVDDAKSDARCEASAPLGKTNFAWGTANETSRKTNSQASTSKIFTYTALRAPDTNGGAHWNTFPIGKSRADVGAHTYESVLIFNENNNPKWKLQDRIDGQTVKTVNIGDNVTNFWWIASFNTPTLTAPLDISSDSTASIGTTSSAQNAAIVSEIAIQ